MVGFEASPIPCRKWLKPIRIRSWIPQNPTPGRPCLILSPTSSGMSRNPQLTADRREDRGGRREGCDKAFEAIQGLDANPKDVSAQVNGKEVKFKMTGKALLWALWQTRAVSARNSSSRSIRNCVSKAKKSGPSSSLCRHQVPPLTSLEMRPPPHKRAALRPPSSRIVPWRSGPDRGGSQRRGRRCPKPMPRILALCRSAASVRFILFAITGSGVRAFECTWSSRTSCVVQGMR